MVRCLTREHNMLVTAGLGLRVSSFIHCATHAHNESVSKLFYAPRTLFVFCYQCTSNANDIFIFLSHFHNADFPSIYLFSYSKFCSLFSATNLPNAIIVARGRCSDNIQQRYSMQMVYSTTSYLLQVVNPEVYCS